METVGFGANIRSRRHRPSAPARPERGLCGFHCRRRCALTASLRRDGVPLAVAPSDAQLCAMYGRQHRRDPKIEQPGCVQARGVVLDRRFRVPSLGARWRYLQPRARPLCAASPSCIVCLNVFLAGARAPPYLRTTTTDLSYGHLVQYLPHAHARERSPWCVLYPSASASCCLFTDVEPPVRLLSADSSTSVRRPGLPLLLPWPRTPPRRRLPDPGHRLLLLPLRPLLPPPPESRVQSRRHRRRRARGGPGESEGQARIRQHDQSRDPHARKRHHRRARFAAHDRRQQLPERPAGAPSFALRLATA